jgi:hypothetical protein
MDKKPLIVVSICAVVLLVLGSLSNVMGYQAVQTSQQNIIKERINQRELLFQTIVDITNNKEIQRIILKSQMSRGIFPTSEIPVLTKNQIRQMYFLGLILSKVISKSRMQSMVQQYQLLNPNIQEEIQGVIEKDATLNSEITQLQNSECDCENEESPVLDFPIICNGLYFLALPALWYLLKYLQKILYLRVLFRFLECPLIFCWLLLSLLDSVSIVGILLHNAWIGISNEKEMVGGWNHSTLRWCDHSTNY